MRYRRVHEESSSDEITPARRKKKPLLSVATQLGPRTNTVASGAGSQRQGQRYRVKTDGKGNFFHVYGRGKNARRVRLSSDVAKSYGYR